MHYERSELETLETCPWCGGEELQPWGDPTSVFDAAICASCRLIFIRTRLNKNGMQRYYASYLSNAHQADIELNKKRDLMYRIDFDFIRQFAPPRRVLDVGCSGGYFLNVFAEHGCNCRGVEFGEEAAVQAQEKFPVQFGDFPDLCFSERFDLVVFRGVVEHVPEPRRYLDKAVELLSENGVVFITATPNADAVCCDLFKEQ